MHSPVITIVPDISFEDAARLLQERGGILQPTARSHSSPQPCCAATPSALARARRRPLDVTCICQPLRQALENRYMTPDEIIRAAAILIHRRGARNTDLPRLTAAIQAADDVAEHANIPISSAFAKLTNGDALWNLYFFRIAETSRIRPGSTSPTQPFTAS